MGGRAAGLFSELGLQVILGINGKVADAILQLEKGNLQGGASLCRPGAGRGYGFAKVECDHPHED
jgi:predicted Fe-Mo cluster-binding NifX family protein